MNLRMVYGKRGELGLMRSTRPLGTEREEGPSCRFGPWRLRALNTSRDSVLNRQSERPDRSTAKRPSKTTAGHPN